MLPGARELAAVLACGPAAFVSHRSAAALWGVAPAVAEDVAVTVIGRGRVCKGVRTHGVAALHRADRDRMRGVPVTSVARTIIDFASEATGDELERGIAEAYARELITDRALYAAMDRVPRRAGVKAVKAELRRAGGPRWTQSEGEQRMLRLIRAARLPAPETQERIAGWPADFLWPDQRLIVEVDGYPFHNHRRAFERDRRRDQAHIAAGYRVIRVTWRQLTEEPFAVIAIIGRALGS
jgi:very-short-patch-repair endonuclease